MSTLAPSPPPPREASAATARAVRGEPAEWGRRDDPDRDRGLPSRLLFEVRLIASLSRCSSCSCGACSCSAPPAPAAVFVKVVEDDEAEAEAEAVAEAEAEAAEEEDDDDAPDPTAEGRRDPCAVRRAARVASCRAAGSTSRRSLFATGSSSRVCKWGMWCTTKRRYSVARVTGLPSMLSELNAVHVPS